MIDKDVLTKLIQLLPIKTKATTTIITQFISFLMIKYIDRTIIEYRNLSMLKLQKKHEEHFKLSGQKQKYCLRNGFSNLSINNYFFSKASCVFQKKYYFLIENITQQQIERLKYKIYESHKRLKYPISKIYNIYSRY